MSPDYVLIRQLPLFDGVGNEDLMAAMAQGGISIRRLERDMFVLDPIGLAQGAPSPVVYVAEGQIAAAVFMEHELLERRAAQVAHETATKEDLEAESLIKPPPLARIALKNIALFMQHDLFNSGALSAARGQPIAFYTTAPSTLLSLDHRWIAELAVRYFREQSQMLAMGKLARPAFKCGAAENARAWSAMIDEFFGGRDLVPAC